MSIRREWQSFDYILLLIACGFALFGVFMVGAALSYMNPTGLPVRYTSQKLFFATGLLVLTAAAIVDYHFIARFYWLIYACMVILLLIVMAISSNDPTNTARWIRIGEHFAIQPSEFSKIFVIVFLAKFIDKYQASINNIYILAIIMALLVIPVVLILKQPALSACMVIAFIGACMIFASGLKARYILISILIITPLVCLFMWDLNNKERVFIDKILGTYQVSRIDTYLNPERDSEEFYQTNASLTSLGSGMLKGKGYREGKYIPMGDNDFIFSVIGEQFGFIGCAGILLTLFIIVVKCLLTANRAQDMLGRLIAVGVAGKLSFEVFVNVGVATAILPNTGMPFPFLSSGGSSMWVNMACIGLVLNVGLFKTKSIFKG